ncbi:tRNA(Met) cytidine acetyltransferase TmcA [Oceanisphaera ostreae]|uniref:tRNA(Met) cytidine acetyltransferase TmcA n=1 Tax=Oceanisphaera ostreae TaxID=914151 RepID=A0ABW3KJI8_9GAMM
MAAAFLTEWHTWRQQLHHSGERRMIVLAGSESWAIAQAIRLIHNTSSRQLWLGQASTNHACLPINKFQTALGQEYDSLIFNAFSGLHPDAFGAATGTLVAGGLMLLLCPPLAEWPDYADPDLARYVAQAEQAKDLNSPFLQRFVQQLQQDDAVIVWQQHTPFPLLPAPSAQCWLQQRDRQGCLNTQQRHALACMLRCARARIPMVLTADRGRGKSSLLGLAAHHLLQAGLKVLLTAPNHKAPAQALQHCASKLQFIAPDALLAEQPYADILLIDEAAAIPVPMLLTLAERYCCIFASTEHGYEGTGLGFQLKFQPQLDDLSPGWRKVHLNIPARWSPNDPLEPLVFRLLAFNAEPLAPPFATSANSELADTERMVSNPLSYRWVTRAALLNNEPLLQQLFGLLTLAHYQTRPSGLRHLLDAPDLLLAATFQDKVPVAVALLTREGPLSTALSQGVWRGQRRPRGHLLPQSLAFHGGLAQATQYTYYRVMRIVVHPHIQQQGIGSLLLSWLQQHLPQQVDCDFIGTSFGASTSLLNFWQNNSFKAVRLGQSRDGVSGLHSIMMLWPCSAQAQKILPCWQGQFSANLQAYRQGIWPEALNPIHQTLSLALPNSSPQQDNLIAHDFAFYHRDLISDQPALSRFIANHAPLRPLSASQQQLLSALVIPGAIPSLVAKQQKLLGQKAALSQLRNTLQHFFKVPSEP